jgi:hypothetical protein
MSGAIANFQKCFTSLFGRRGCLVVAGNPTTTTSVGGQSLLLRLLASSSSHRLSSLQTSAVLAAKDAKKEASELPSEAVFYHPRQNMYVCWHPEVPFPYEMSKPIPAEAPVTESNLKIQSLVPVRNTL